MKTLQHRRAMELLTHARVYFPAVVPRVVDAGAWLVYSATEVIGGGPTIGAAYEDARRRDNLPEEPHFLPFRGERFEVYQGSTIVAHALSRTMADRIANALNQYVPNVRKS